MKELENVRKYLEELVKDDYTLDPFLEKARFDYCYGVHFIVFDYENETYEVDLEEQTLYNINDKDNTINLDQITIEELSNNI